MGLQCLFPFFADNEEQLNRKERSCVEDPVNAHLFAEEETRTRKRQQPPNPGQSAKRARTQDNQNDNEVSWPSMTG